MFFIILLTRDAHMGCIQQFIIFKNITFLTLNLYFYVKLIKYTNTIRTEILQKKSVIHRIVVMSL